MNNIPMQPQVVAFKLVRSSDTRDFEHLVNELLSEGWQPQGTAQIDNLSSHWFMPMVKVELRPMKVVRPESSGLTLPGPSSIMG